MHDSLIFQPQDNIYLSRYILSCRNRRDGDGVHVCSYSASGVVTPAEASVRAQAACMLDNQREDCGEWLMICTHYNLCSQITKVMRGCPVCACTGYVGVNKQICSRKGCCWNPRDVSQVSDAFAPLLELE